MILAALVLAAEAAAPDGTPPDEVAFEILVGTGSVGGFRIDANERIEQFDRNPHSLPTEPEVSTGSAGTYALAHRQFARYRSLAGAPCAPLVSDVLAFRLSWREAGSIHTATFADSCGGIPTDLVEAMRPIGVVIESGAKPDDGQ